MERHGVGLRLSLVAIVCSEHMGPTAVSEPIPVRSKRSWAPAPAFHLAAVILTPCFS